VRALDARRAALESAAASAPAPPAFAAALRGGRVAVIAEIKRRSPSRGAINAALRAPDRAAAYVAGGAAAISVLTEPDRFGGSADDLRSVSARVAVPVLCKDFIVDALQLVEARALGAAAALLIVRALDPARLLALVDAARRLGVEPLLEVRDAAELALALDAGAQVIGVNSRDLETLRLDPDTWARVLPAIPGPVIAVAESGVAGRADVVRAGLLGADAVLVGSSLSGGSAAATAVAALADVPWVGRGRGEGGDR
jgi:indole-3-glycerol phosphate synthase